MGEKAKNKLTVKEAAALIGCSEQFIRCGLQTKELPFGFAIKMSSMWTYNISLHLVKKYIGEQSQEETKTG